MSPRALYRAYLGHLRHIPDPHVWGILAPRFRELLQRANEPQAESSTAAQARQEHAVKRVKEAERYLRAAVACHPHALQRILEQCYGVRGRVKWELVKNVTLSMPVPKEEWPAFALEKDQDPQSRFPPVTYQPIPAALRPLARYEPTPIPTVRARTNVPLVMQKRGEKNAWEFCWKRIYAPLILPPQAGEVQGRTGWEGMGVVESLRILAGAGEVHQPPPPRRSGLPVVQNKRDPLPTLSHLPASLRACFPKRPVKHVKLDYPRPRPASTRQNPKTWGNPTSLTPRLLRRMYAHLWQNLPWVMQKNGKWTKCSYAELAGESRPHHVVAEATEEEMKWLDGL